ncbi:MAG TPA: hypothetical protein VGR81_14030 [Candidatus Acidoferrales bacterium]|nr:hypothetical protein [Candidatus Acidoferrales bacterium]
MTVTVQPPNATVLIGQSEQFTAAVSGVASNAVIWSVSGIVGGNSTVGTISSAGLYTAPSSLPNPPSVSVTASSQSVPSASGSATVQLQSGIIVFLSPNSANLAPGGSADFTASVTGVSVTNSAASWSVNNVPGGNSTLGTIASTGADSATYTAPAIPPSPDVVTIKATSVTDSSKFASATVTISCVAPNSLSPATASVDLGAAQSFSASLCVAPGTPITWEVNNVTGGSSTLGTISSTSSGATAAIYTAPSVMPTVNPVTIQAVAGSQSASATITIVNTGSISLSLTPSSATRAPGQTALFTASVTGAANSMVTWTVNGIANGNSTVGQVCALSSNSCAPPSGTQVSVDYLAPQSPPQPSIVTLTVTSTIAPAATASAQITILPPAQPGISIAPFYTFLAPSQQFQFLADTSSLASSAVSWSVSSAVPGQGCSGALCGSIDNSGNFAAPAAAPSPNAIAITAASVANPSLSATATVALTSGPVIERILPSAVVAGAQNTFTLAVNGLNFLPTTSSGSSQLLVNDSPRTTNCSTSSACTITLQPSDVATAGTLTIELQNPGAPTALSNPVSFVILPAPSSPSPILLTAAAPLAQKQDIIVPEPTTAGATTSPMSVDFVGMVSPGGSTCTIQGSPLFVALPASGSTTISICVQGNFLDPTFSYSFTSPQTGGDIGITTGSMASLFPNLVELTLTLSSSTAPGLRSLFITSPNGDIAVATGVLEVQ